MNANNATVLAQIANKMSTTQAAYVTIEEAAARLSMSAVALRARCRRRARREGRDVVARLGGGVTAYKFGASWRLRFPD
jgi:hypothetical protein